MAGSKEKMESLESAEKKKNLYKNWPTDADGIPMVDLPDKFLDIRDFEYILGDLKKNKIRYFCWYPNKINEMTGVRYERPKIQSKIDNLPYVTFSRTVRFPYNAIRINTTTGLFAKYMDDLKNLVKETEERYEKILMPVDEHIEKGEDVANKVLTIVTSMLEILNRVRDKPESDFAGVCTFRAFEKKFEWLVG